MDSYDLAETWPLRSDEPSLLLGFSEFPDPSDLWDLCDDLGALRLAKKEREVSRVCLGVSRGEGGYWGIAVRPGVDGWGARPGEVGKVGLFDLLLLESWVTGRMVAPLKNGELEEDLGERGVRGLGPSELWAPGVSGEAIFTFVWSVAELRSKLGTVDCLDGILGVYRGSEDGPRGNISER